MGELKESRLYICSQYIWKRGRIHWRTVTYIFLITIAPRKMKLQQTLYVIYCDISRYTWKKGENSLRHGYIHIYIFFLIHIVPRQLRIQPLKHTTAHFNNIVWIYTVTFLDTTEKGENSLRQCCIKNIITIPRQIKLQPLKYTTVRYNNIVWIYSGTFLYTCEKGEEIIATRLYVYLKKKS